MHSVTRKEIVDKLSRDQLVSLLIDHGKDLIALDGCWFQSLEQALGMDVAMRCDCSAWMAFEHSEARRAKAFLGLSEHPGLEGLAQSLLLRSNSFANNDEVVFNDDGTLDYRVLACRVQAARTRKGMELHPCKAAGTEEYTGFAHGIDDRISCECLSCHPDDSDNTCSCAWHFCIKGPID